MNVATITMPKAEAMAKLRAYEKALRRRKDAEYSAALQGYRELAKGTPLLHLAQAIRSSGFDEKMRPRLAVGRSDRRQVRFTWRHRDTVGVFDTVVARRERSRRWGPDVRILVDMLRSHERTVLARDGKRYFADVDGYALVPMVPPDVRPSGPLSDYLTLWEVEAWADSEIGAEPDRDPMLLKHIGGDLYAVVAQWDLTDLERAVMEGRGRVEGRR